jgi:hypothetical protein
MRLIRYKDEKQNTMSRQLQSQIKKAMLGKPQQRGSFEFLPFDRSKECARLI